MKRLPWRTALEVLLLGICAFGLFSIVRQSIEYKRANEAHDLAVSIVTSPNPAVMIEESDPPLRSEPIESGTAGEENPEPEPDPEPEPNLEPNPIADELLAYNLSALQMINPDVLGWIYIPGTDINYPLLQADDNSTYLSLSWEGKENVAGSIFLDYKSDASMQDFNTIVYGHNMKNGSMFAGLLKYRQQSYYDENNEIWVVTAEGAYRYLIFSAYEARVDSDTYAIGFADEETTQAALDYYILSSRIVTDIEPTTSDRLLTLSTCVGNGLYSTRWVVQAVLTAEYPRT